MTVRGRALTSAPRRVPVAAGPTSALYSLAAGAGLEGGRLDGRHPPRGGPGLTRVGPEAGPPAWRLSARARAGAALERAFSIEARDEFDNPTGAPPRPPPPRYKSDADLHPTPYKSDAYLSPAPSLRPVRPHRAAGPPPYVGVPYRPSAERGRLSTEGVYSRDMGRGNSREGGGGGGDPAAPAGACPLPC